MLVQLLVTVNSSAFVDVTVPSVDHFGNRFIAAQRIVIANDLPGRQIIYRRVNSGVAASERTIPAGFDEVLPQSANQAPFIPAESNRWLAGTIPFSLKSDTGTFDVLVLFES